MTPSLRQKQKTALSDIDPAKYGFHDDIKPLYETDFGLTEGIVKKDVKVQEVVGEGYVPPIRVALPFPVRLTASVSSQWIWPRLHG